MCHVVKAEEKLLQKKEKLLVEKNKSIKDKHKIHVQLINMDKKCHVAVDDGSGFSEIVKSH
jgi:cellobiose-specific phosphotransferase system component IIA